MNALVDSARRAASLLALLVCGLLAGGCASLPPGLAGPPSAAVKASPDTALGRIALAAAPEAEPPLAVARSFDGTRLAVLLVDDEVEVLAALSTYLHQLGWSELQLHSHRQRHAESDDQRSTRCELPVCE